MKTMTLSILATLAIGCASKVADEPEVFPEADADADSDADADADADSDADADADANNDNDRDGFTVGEGDCDDGDKDIYPGATERCNGEDDDCDDRIDEGLETSTFYEDYDNDGYGDPDVDVDACAEPDGYVANNEDCDDTDRTANPEGNEESWNGVDEDCDGFDFSGEACVDEALDLTMDWIGSWTWSAAPSSGTYLFINEWNMTDKTITVNPDTTSATAGEDGTTVDVIIDTNVTMNAAYTGTNLLSGDCDVSIGPVAVRYQGTVELDITGEEIGGEVELSHIVVGDPSSSMDWGTCSTGVLSAIIGYIGYDITTFLDSDFDSLAQELGDKIEDDLIIYDIPSACEPEGGASGGSGICENTCDFADDGACDDGGPGAEYDLCELGTDCNDCGPR